jgi:tetratricopeptide (TPR) repeat protein
MKIFLKITLSILLIFAGVINAQDAEMAPEAAKHYNQGNSLMKAGNYQAAVKEYDTALKDSKDYRIFYQKAIALKRQQKYDDAIEAFKSSIADNSEFSYAYNGLGGIYFAQGKYEDAVDAFKNFENKSEGARKKQAREYIARALTKLGDAQRTNGNYDQAVKYLTEAVSYANFDAAYLALAGLYVDLGKFDKAISAANNAIKYRKSISKGAPYYYRGLAYKGKGNTQKAKEDFQVSINDRQYKKNSQYELKLMR